MDTQEAMRVLKGRGVYEVVIPFEGGNDEGFTHDAELYDAAKQKIGAIKEFWRGYTYDPRTRTSSRIDPSSEDEALYETLVQPINERYGSFAGEFHVQGDLVWDVARGTSEFRGTYSEYVDRPL